MWWFRDDLLPIDAKFLGPSTIGWASGVTATSGGTFELRGLDGTLLHTVGGKDLQLDQHDLQLLPNGDYLAIVDVPRDDVDLSTWDLSDHAQVTDNVIVELNSSNQIVWSWSAADHIDVATANRNWHDQSPDVIHMNSIQYVGNNEIIVERAASRRRVRHRHAHRLDQLEARWNPDAAESLTAVHDPYTSVNPDGLFSGQHDARILPGGTLTVHDNGTRCRLRPVRAVRFAIDTQVRHRYGAGAGRRRPARRSRSVLRGRGPAPDRRLARVVGHRATTCPS